MDLRPKKGEALPQERKSERMMNLPTMDGKLPEDSGKMQIQEAKKLAEGLYKKSIKR
jgi:hypothetical protein